MSDREFRQRMKHLAKVARHPATRELADITRTLHDTGRRILALLSKHRVEGHTRPICREIEARSQGGPGVWDGILTVATMIHLYVEVIDPDRPDTGLPPARPALAATG